MREGALPRGDAAVLGGHGGEVEDLRVVEPRGLARDRVRPRGGLHVRQPQAPARAPGEVEAVLAAPRLDRGAVGRGEHLVPALQLPEIEARAAARAVVVADVAHALLREAGAHLGVEIAVHRAEVDDGRLAARARRGAGGSRRRAGAAGAG